MRKALAGIVLIAATGIVGCSSSPSGSDAYCKVVADTAPAIAKLNQLGTGTGTSSAAVDQVFNDAKQAMASRRQASPPDLRPSWDAVDLELNAAKESDLSAKDQQAARDGTVAIDKYTTDVCKGAADMGAKGSSTGPTPTHFTTVPGAIS